MTNLLPQHKWAHVDNAGQLALLNGRTARRALRGADRQSHNPRENSNG